MITKELYDKGIRCRGICAICNEDVLSCQQYMTEVKGTRLEKPSISNLYNPVVSLSSRVQLELGLRIKPAFGDNFDVWGVVSTKNFPVDGKIYYCNDSSYPEACVEEVYTVSKTAEELYKLVMKEEGKQ